MIVADCVSPMHAISIRSLTLCTASWKLVQTLCSAAFESLEAPTDHHHSFSSDAGILKDHTQTLLFRAIGVLRMGLAVSPFVLHHESSYMRPDRFNLT